MIITFVFILIWCVPTPSSSCLTQSYLVKEWQAFVKRLQILTDFSSCMYSYFKLHSSARSDCVKENTAYTSYSGLFCKLMWCQTLSLQGSQLTWDLNLFLLVHLYAEKNPLMSCAMVLCISVTLWSDWHWACTLGIDSVSAKRQCWRVGYSCDLKGPGKSTDVFFPCVLQCLKLLIVHNFFCSLTYSLL